MKPTPLETRCPEQTLDDSRKYVCRRNGLPCEYLVVANCQVYQIIRYNHQLAHKHRWFGRTGR